MISCCTGIGSTSTGQVGRLLMSLLKLGILEHVVIRYSLVKWVQLFKTFLSYGCVSQKSGLNRQHKHASSPPEWNQAGLLNLGIIYLKWSGCSVMDDICTKLPHDPSCQLAGGGSSHGGLAANMYEPPWSWAAPDTSVGNISVEFVFLVSSLDYSCAVCLTQSF